MKLKNIALCYDCEYFTLEGCTENNCTLQNVATEIYKNKEK